MRKKFTLKVHSQQLVVKIVIYYFYDSRGLIKYKVKKKIRKE